MRRIGLIGVVIVMTMVAVVVNLSTAQEGGGGETHLETGACCLPDGSCTSILQGPCEIFGGVWNGEDTPCFSFDCTRVKVVSVTVDKDRIAGTEYRIFRAYSNGDVDVTWVDLGSGGECDVPLRCGPVSIIP